jgi:tRNA threonylcarbamoyladenosine biosynthesis protein TsaB
MRLIALETATEACSAALWIDGSLRWLLEREAARRHGELVLEQVQRLLAEAGLVPAQLDAIAVGRGPGAFTGVRLGLGVAQGLAFATGIPVVPVSTLAALGQQGADRGAREVLAVLDARMREVYWSLLQPGPDGLMASAAESLSAPEDVRANWGASPRLALGSGLAAYPELARQLGLEESESMQRCCLARARWPSLGPRRMPVARRFRPSRPGLCTCAIAWPSPRGTGAIELGARAGDAARRT